MNLIEKLENYTSLTDDKICYIHDMIPKERAKELLKEAIKEIEDLFDFPECKTKCECEICTTIKKVIEILGDVE